jgi:hypothetical protein
MHVVPGLAALQGYHLAQGAEVWFGLPVHLQLIMHSVG